jgi:hypothetical protein
MDPPAVLHSNRPSVDTFEGWKRRVNNNNVKTAFANAVIPVRRAGIDRQSAQRQGVS